MNPADNRTTYVYRYMICIKFAYRACCESLSRESEKWKRLIALNSISTWSRFLLEFSKNKSCPLSCEWNQTGENRAKGESQWPCPGWWGARNSRWKRGVQNKSLKPSFPSILADSDIEWIVYAYDIRCRSGSMSSLNRMNRVRFTINLKKQNPKIFTTTMYVR